jgi:tetratricopeptide (TPR) repeat protein
MKRSLFLGVLLVAAVARADVPASMGSIDFPVSGGTPEAREHLMRGLLALHSFWYDEAEAQMAAAVKADPTFAMGWWGVAFGHSKLLWQADDLEASRAALAKITGVEKLTPLERAWIEAVRALVGDGNKRERRAAFAAALEKMHAQFPKDDEVTTFYALALLSSSPPDDPNEIAVRARAAALAMEVFQRNPKHPGAAHYIIHALDTSDLAPLALPAAREYAAIAPDAFHARHMPAHIFSRLGMWKEALASCQSAWESSVGFAQRSHLGTNAKDFHSLNWIMEINLALGNGKAADAAVKLYADGVRSGMDYRWRSMYTFALGKYVDVTGRWDRVEELLKPLQAAMVDRKAGEGHQHGAAMDLEEPPMDVVERMAATQLRLGAAVQRKDMTAVNRYAGELDRMKEQTRAFEEHQVGKEKYAEEMHELALMREAVLAKARGDDKAELEAYRKLAEIYDKLPVGEWGLFDGGIHEEIADVLLRMKQGKEALADYQKVIGKHPAYARALLGAARAAALAGDAAAAKSYYAKAADVWAGADADFPGVAEARKGR